MEYRPMMCNSCGRTYNPDRLKDLGDVCQCGKTVTHYTLRFEKLMDRTPRVDAKGRDISDSTRLNMALSMWQKEEFPESSHDENEDEQHPAKPAYFPFPEPRHKTGHVDGVRALVRAR